MVVLRTCASKGLLGKCISFNWLWEVVGFLRVEALLGQGCLEGKPNGKNRVIWSKTE